MVVFNKEIENFLSASTIGDMKIYGSSADPLVKYSADYDCMCVVNGSSKQELAEKLQSVVQKCLKLGGIFLDSKIGEDDSLKVLPYDYKYYNAQKSIDILNDIKNISSDTKKELESLLLPKLTLLQFIMLEDVFKYHIYRWTSADVIKGSKNSLKLSDALGDGLVKLDWAIWTDGFHYSEVSVIYDLFLNGKPLNRPVVPIKRALAQDVIYQIAKGNYWKASKRLYSLAKQLDDKELIEKLLVLLNSDLGNVATVLADCNTLIEMNRNNKSVEFEIDQFRSRMAKVRVPSWIHHQTKWLALLDDVKTPAGLQGFADYLQKMVNTGSKEYLIQSGIL